jgi:hypothetical protein
MDFVHGDQADRRQSREHPHNDKQVVVENEKEAHADIDVEAANSTPYEEGTAEEAEAIRARDLQQKKGILRKLRQGEEWLDAKMGIETQGVDRIREEDKRPPSILNVFFMWWSVTCHVGTLPIGMVGPEMGLTLRQSVAGIVVGTVLGALCTAWCGILGPKVRTRTADSPVLETH